ncbi:ferredoxin-type protein NapF [Yangia mangrovi]|uniref:Ferredoxin-type protein NapF n=3 Tax=Alloyangia mangrovi TaxID=1779329 RepID=A0ABT2KLR0_9RHOB|nr:ferredoxin-type protein NapF [Alloyangia mangrovi]MCA0942139.1 ferredoxin-type protein NapF [Alloyangia pacifica]MCA0947168.1 ferredoxin-type protein NapF [Alloyangia pacifica]MCT4371057.1 ferredoxin-type protein NapF [Alloyangia mangrovi]
MTTQHSRRDFLRGQVSRPAAPLMRPPGAQTGFSQLCNGCGACASACPEAIIIRHEGPAGRSTPVVDFSKGACTFCGACAEACDTGALSAQAVPDWPWRAIITDSCLSLGGISCRSCEDACEPRAIRFRLMTGGRAAPVLDSAQCTGCGDCAATCPAGAVTFEQPAPAAEGRA